MTRRSVEVGTAALLVVPALAGLGTLGRVIASSPASRARKPDA